MDARLPGIEAVGQVHVNCRDLERATAFYRDVLGLRFLFAIPGSAFFDAGNLRLMVGVAEGLESDHPASVLYYRVPDIHAAFEAVRASAPVEGEPHLIARMPDHELWMAFLRDPEGNLFALMSEVRGG
jgi:methylmalonyl-CoA/ethylmalonyl-CoA epimerase